jgi:hypothetical protein
MLQSISHHSSAYFSTHNLTENEAVPEMSQVTYYHSKVRLSLTEFFSSFILFSLTTKILILLIKRPLLRFKRKKLLLFWHKKLCFFTQSWKYFNRVEVYLWRRTKSVPHTFLKGFGRPLVRIHIVLRGVNCPTSKRFSKFLVHCFIKFNQKWTKEIFDVWVRKACVPACCWARR